MNVNNLKVGDKLYCKKTKDNYHNYLGLAAYKGIYKGKFYDVINVSVHGFIVVDKKSGEGFGFSWFKFGEYFYTEKELRKIKLDKIKTK